MRKFLRASFAAVELVFLFLCGLGIGLAAGSGSLGLGRLLIGDRGNRRRRLALDFGFIAQSGKGRWKIGAQREQVDPRRLGIGEFEVEVADDLVVIAVGKEVEVLALRIPHGQLAVDQIAGDSGDLLRLQ